MSKKGTEKSAVKKFANAVSKFLSGADFMRVFQHACINAAIRILINTKPLILESAHD
jgi:hypothetical protein